MTFPRDTSPQCLCGADIPTKRVQVSFEVDVPVDATPLQIEEWLRFNLNDNGSMSDQPLANWECAPRAGTFSWKFVGGK